MNTVLDYKTSLRLDLGKTKIWIDSLGSKMCFSRRIWDSNRIYFLFTLLLYSKRWFYILTQFTNALIMSKQEK